MLEIVSWYYMDHLDPKRLGFVIYLGLRIHQFQKYHLLKEFLGQNSRKQMARNGLKGFCVWTQSMHCLLDRFLPSWQCVNWKFRSFKPVSSWLNLSSSLPMCQSFFACARNVSSILSTFAVLLQNLLVKDPSIQPNLKTGISQADGNVF